MAAYDSVDLLARLRLQIRRPTADESLTDAQAYQLLTDAQQIAFEDITVRAPFANMTAPTLMTSSDSGRTYVFGTDANGDAIAPLGHVQIYRNTACVPDSPLIEGQDYLNEGTKIRIPNNRTMPAPYWQGVLPPAAISAASAPTLLPATSRVMVVYKAAALYASLGDLRDASKYESMYADAMAKHLLRLKTEFMNQGGYAMRNGSSGVAWWRSMTLN